MTVLVVLAVAMTLVLAGCDPIEVTGPASAGASQESGSSGAVGVTEARQMSFDGPCVPVLAPDGDRHLCQRSVGGHPELWLGSITGGMERKLADGAVVPHWGRDSSRVLYTPAPEAGESPLVPVVVLDVDGGDIAEVGPALFRHPLQGLVDGRVAYITPAGLELAHPTTGVRTLVPLVFRSEHLAAAQHQGTPDTILSWPEWPYAGLYWEVDPGGTRVALLRQTTGLAIISILDVGTGEEVLLSDQVDSRVQHPFAWSPEGDRLAYAVSTGGETPRQELWVVNADGSGAEWLWQAELETHHPLDSVTWRAGIGVVFGRTDTSWLDTSWWLVRPGAGEAVELVRGSGFLQVAAGSRLAVWSRQGPQQLADETTWWVGEVP